MAHFLSPWVHKLTVGSWPVVDSWRIPSTEPSAILRLILKGN
jgi:hypothetical protein